MSAPISIAQSPQIPVELLTTAVQAVVEQAKALGLTWTLRLATVDITSPLTIIYDGDTVPLNAVSMAGNDLAEGQRVYVIMVPPAGNFVVGKTASANVALRLRRTLINLANSVATPIAWDQIDEEGGGNWISAGSTSIVIPKSGWYNLMAEMEMASPGVPTSLQWIGFMITSTIPNWTGTSYRGSWSNAQTTGTVMANIPLLAGDTIEASMFQGSYGGVFVAARFTALRVASFVL